MIEYFWAIDFFLLKSTSILSVIKGQLNDFGFKSGFFLGCDWNKDMVVV
jgi:hypothetical protein